MKKLLLALVVFAAMLTLSACSDSTGVADPTDDGLTDYHCIRGVVYQPLCSEGADGATVSLYKSGYSLPYMQTTSHYSCTCGHGFYDFDMLHQSYGSYKVVAEKGPFEGTTGWFYWGGGSTEVDVTMQ